jgi:hypothetical protein
VFGLKVLFAVLLVVACTCFCLFWNTSVQPDLASQQGMRQMELYTNGQGDALAKERRLVTETYHWPRFVAMGLTVAFLAAMFAGDVSKIVKKGVNEL